MEPAASPCLHGRDARSPPRSLPLAAVLVAPAASAPSRVGRRRACGPRSEASSRRRGRRRRPRRRPRHRARAVRPAARTAPLTPASIEKLYTTGDARCCASAPSGRLRHGGAGVRAGRRRRHPDRLPLPARRRRPHLRQRVLCARTTTAPAPPSRTWRATCATPGCGASRARSSATSRFFDRARGTAPYGFRAAGDIEGLLERTVLQPRLRPAAASSPPRAVRGAAARRRAAQPSACTVGELGANAPSPPPARGSSPTWTRRRWPRSSRLTNRPSDNFFAETLHQGPRARASAAQGTTAAGAGVVRATLGALRRPRRRVVDGSGLSHTDRTTPAPGRHVLPRLRRTAADSAFDGLAGGAPGAAARSATRMRGTPAAGNCRAKTGTLTRVSRWRATATPATATRSPSRS